VVTVQGPVTLDAAVPLIHRPGDLNKAAPALRADDIAVVLHAQGLGAIVADIALLESYAALGLRVAQLTYNYRNQLADGCLEPADSGLSEAGRAAVRRLNALRIVVSPGQPDVHDLARHAVHIADLVGPEHVVMGLDYAVEDDDDYGFYGYDERYYPRLPWTWPPGIESHAEVRSLRSALLTAGFPPVQATGILGENFLRIFAHS
jgi:microsomal dipeptidase-like Zn-dependent dipeptidase